MTLWDWHTLVVCMLLQIHGYCLSIDGGSFGHFRKVENVDPSQMALASLRAVTGLACWSPCSTLCLLSTCRSLVYDQSSRTCYLSNVELNVTSSRCMTTSITYMELCTLCNDSTRLSTCCPSKPTTYTGCIDAKNKCNSVSGTYYVDPDGLGPFLVWCDFVGNEAWTVFQRRFNGSVDFFQGWQTYKNGFGETSGEYWLGLERIYRLTKASSPMLNIYLDDFEGNSRTANYSSMTITDETSFYRLSLGSYTGDAGNAMQSGMNFSTYDRDNDAHPSLNCAQEFRGAWWYGACHSSNLNGAYLRGPHLSYADGVEWYPWHKFNYSLRTTIMRLAV